MRKYDFRRSSLGLRSPGLLYDPEAVSIVVPLHEAFSYIVIRAFDPVTYHCRHHNRTMALRNP